MSSNCVFKRSVSEKEIESCSSYFRSTSFVNLSEDDIKANIEIGFTKISSSFDSFEGHGSGWVLETITCLDRNIGKYQSLTPSSYIDIPKELVDKHAVINIRNYD